MVLLITYYLIPLETACGFTGAKLHSVKVKYTKVLSKMTAQNTHSVKANSEYGG